MIIPINQDAVYALLSHILGAQQGSTCVFLHQPLRPGLKVERQTWGSRLLSVAADQIEIVPRHLTTKKPSEYLPYKLNGSGVAIGRTFAIMEANGVRFSGRLAKLAWAFLHIWYLMQNEDRLIIFMKWVWYYFTGTRGTRLIDRQTNAPR